MSSTAADGGAQPRPIRTARMELVCATAELARAAAHDHERFGRMLGARVPAEWPQALMRDAMDWVIHTYERDPEIGGWGVWYIVLRVGREVQAAGGDVVIGTVGFKGRPGVIGGPGTVEIGYGILEEFHRRGLGSEAVGAMTAWALGRAGVERVIAHTFETLHGSLGVLRACGYRYVGPGFEKVPEEEARGMGQLVLWERRK